MAGQLSWGRISGPGRLGFYLKIGTLPESLGLELGVWSRLARALVRIAVAPDAFSGHGNPGSWCNVRGAGEGRSEFVMESGVVSGTPS